MPLSSISCVFKQLLLLGALVISLGSQVAVAQPVLGQTYKDFLPMGSGASVPLPDGVWKSTHNDSMTIGPEVWQVHTLKNQMLNAKVPYLVVRLENLPRPWGPTNCRSSKSPHQFMVNVHGVGAGELLQKCSRFFGINDFQSWKDIDKWTSSQADKNWWNAAMPGMLDENPPFKTSILMAELSVNQFNGRYVRVEAFLLPPRGMSARMIKDDAQAEKMRSEHDIMSGWASIYIESIQQSFFNKSPQAIMALAYPVKTFADTQSPDKSQAPVSVAKANTQAMRDLDETSRADAAKRLEDTDIKNKEQPNKKTEQPTAQSDRVKTAQDAKGPGAPAVAQVSGSTSPSDNTEKLKLEQERKAIEDDKRNMAAQLEAMKQMLAKLQQENAAAAKAKEAAAAAPVEPPKPQQPVAYANRKALVIGNDKYTDVAPLNNAAADADAMAKSLELVGYKVFKHHNLTEKKFKQAVRDFRQQLNGGDEVLFFYAGHGVQLGAANYLLPIDVKGEGEDQVKDDAILLQKVLDDMEEKKTKFALAVIDACRDNPFKGKGRALGGRGLAPTTAATGQMIMFSAGSGQQALDRLGDNDKEKNGLFTRIFVKEMLKPGLTVDRVLRNVRNEVVRLAKSVGHEQTPALYDQAIGEFYFKQ